MYTVFDPAPGDQSWFIGLFRRLREEGLAKKMGWMHEATGLTSKEFVDEFAMPDGRRLNLLGEGRLVNLAAAEGHPASVMAMSFATQALASEWAVKNQKNLTAKVYEVPSAVENWVAKLKLSSMGIRIDSLTKDQEKYLSSWAHGT